MKKRFFLNLLVIFFFFGTSTCIPVDADFDEVDDFLDNCPEIYNPDQRDYDDDMVGDACDQCPYDQQNDIDEDGFCGDIDNCRLESNPEQEDLNNDGLGDVCDPIDRDNDGIRDEVDNCPTIINFRQDDSDDDKIGDACESGAFFITPRKDDFPPSAEADAQAQESIFFYSAVETDDKKVMIAGSRIYNTSYSIPLLVLFDPLTRTEVWRKIFPNGGKYGEFLSIIKVADGYILCGRTSTSSNNYSRLLLLKTDFNGVEIWRKMFGTITTREYYGRNVVQTSDSGFILTGDAPKSGKTTSDVYLVRTNVSGVKIWETQFDGGANDSGKAILEDKTNNQFWILGNKWGADSVSSSGWLIKVDSTGKKLWDKSFSTSPKNRGDALSLVDGNLVIIGKDNEDFTWEIAGQSGDLYLQKNYDRAASSDYAHSMVYNKVDKKFALTGESSIVSWTIQLDIGGSQKWSTPFAGKGVAKSWSVVLMSTGKYIVVGSTKSSSGSPSEGMILQMNYSDGVVQ